MVESTQSTDFASKKPSLKKSNSKSPIKQFSINTTCARSDLALLDEIIEDNKWQKVEGRSAKADMYWQVKPE